MKKDGVAMMESTHLIESVEDDWNTTCIMEKGRIAKTCRREDLTGGKDLEDLFFSITEKPKEAAV